MSYPVGRLTGPRAAPRPKPPRPSSASPGTKSGERKGLRRVVAFNRLPSSACPKHKGDQVSVTGRLDYDTWDGKDGKKHSQIKIVANQVEFLAKAKGNGSAHEETRPPAPAEEEVEPGF